MSEGPPIRWVSLSFLLILVPWSAGFPSEYYCPLFSQHVTSRTEEGIVFALSMDDSIYSTEECVHLSYSIQNVGPDTVSIVWSGFPYDHIRIYPDTCITMDQADCEPLLDYPFVLYPAGHTMKIPPGSCSILTENWNISWCQSLDPQPGTYRAFAWLYRQYWWSRSGNLDEMSLLTLDLVVHDASTGIPELPSGATTWGRIKALFKEEWPDPAPDFQTVTRLPTQFGYSGILTAKQVLRSSTLGSQTKGTTSRYRGGLSSAWRTSSVAPDTAGDRAGDASAARGADCSPSGVGGSSYPGGGRSAHTRRRACL
jgi:hypothetical protein